MTDADEPRALLLGRLGLASAPSRFDEALTHPSFANEQRERAADNQRLEFLGDGVLDLCVSELLLARMPEADEGALTRVYQAIVSTEALARWARGIALGDVLLLGRGARKQGEHLRDKVLADAVEAIVAAVYLDGGLDAARALCARLVDALLEGSSDATGRDAKSELQELVQRTSPKPPIYVVVGTEGPDHDRWFVSAVEIDGARVATGRGRSKKLAEQAAATEALARLRGATA